MSSKKSAAKQELMGNFSFLMEDHPIPMWIHDSQDESILEMSRAALKQFGYRRSDIGRRKLEDIFPADEVPLLRANLRRIRRTRQLPGEWHIRHKDGRSIMVFLTFSSIVYQGHQAVLATAQLESGQTFERRILEARLRISEFSRFKLLDQILQKTLDEIESLTGSCIGFFHFVEADQKTLSLQNWSTNTLANMCTAEGKWSHYAIDKAGVWVECVHQRKPVIYNDYPNLEHRKGMPPGHATVLRFLSIPIIRNDAIAAIVGVGNKPEPYNDEDVRIASLLADMAWDLAGQKRAEDELRQREERLRIVSENPYDWEFWQDAQGNFLYTSPSCERITGHAIEEFLSDPDLLSEIIHPDDREIFRHHKEQVHAQRSVGSLDFRIIQPNGGIRWIGHVCQPVFSVYGAYLGVRGSNRDVTERKQTEFELLEAKRTIELINLGLRQALEREQRVSRTDSLTELYNRRHFYELAEPSMDVARRYGSPLSLVMFDIDHFKRFNDDYGHLAGDEVLKQVAKIALAQLRRADIFARFGGEEFIALLPNSVSDQACVVADRVREAVANHRMEFHGKAAAVTLSAGIAEYSSDIRSLDEFINRADQALYAAKQAGRNCMQIYSPSTPGATLHV